MYDFWTFSQQVRAKDQNVQEEEEEEEEFLYILILKMQSPYYLKNAGN
jgi:hypothetical protein